MQHTRRDLHTSTLFHHIHMHRRTSGLLILLGVALNMIITLYYEKRCEKNLLASVNIYLFTQRAINFIESSAGEHK